MRFYLVVAGLILILVGEIIFSVHVAQHGWPEWML